MENQEKEQNKGKISQIIGAVVNVEFPEGDLPEIYDALIVENSNHEIAIIFKQ